MANEYLIQGKLVLDISNPNKQLEEVGSKTKGIENSSKQAASRAGLEWTKFGDKLQKVGGKLTKTLTLPILGMGAAALKYASDMDETLSKTDAVFGDNQQQIKDWANTTIESFGVGKQSALDMASEFGAMGISMKVPEQAAADMAMALGSLAGDMASFHNISIERAQVALKGIYTGETEALKTLGIVMTEQNLKEFAKEAGLVYEEMSQAEKVQLRYNYVMENTSQVQGDFARTSDSVSNQTRVLQEKLKEAATSIGQNLLPIAKDLLEQVNGWLTKFNELPASTQSAVLWGLGVVAAVGPVLKIAGDVSSAIGKMKGAFGQGDIGLSTIGWVAGALAVVGTIAAIVVSVKNGYDTIYGDANALNTAMADMGKKFEDADRQYEKDITNINRTISLADDYIDRLVELEETGVETTAQQREYAGIVAALRQTMPELNIKIDEQTGMLEDGALALKQQVRDWKALAVQQAMTLRHQTKMDAYTDAIIAQAEAQEKLKERTEEITKNKSRLAEVERELEIATGKTAAELNAMSRSEAAAFWRGASREVQLLRLEQNDLLSSTQALESGTSSLETALTTATTQVEAAGLEVDKTQLSVEAAYAVIGTTDELDKGKEGLDGVGTAAEEASEAAKLLEEAMRQARENIVNDFEQLSLSGGKALTDLTNTLLNNAKVYNSTIANMDELTKKGVNEGILVHLYNMGEEGWQIIDKMNKATPKQLEAFVAAFTQAGTMSETELKEALDKLPPEVKKVLGIAESEAREAGVKTANGYGGGMDDNIEVVRAAARRLANAATGALKTTLEIASPSKKAKREIGVPFAQGIGVGIEEGLKNVVKMAKVGTGNLLSGAAPSTGMVAKQVAKATPKQANAGNIINQHNTFTAKTLSPYEQRIQLKKLDNDLAEVFA